MKRASSIAAFGAGLIFAIGLGLAGMTRPAKVIGFLDLFGDWDPSLACVMGAALIVAFVGFRLVLRRGRPILEPTFHVPGRGQIDRRLLLGAAIFGVGWGLGGFCPGPALVALASGAPPVLLFVIAMGVGAKLCDWLATPPAAKPVRQ